MNIIDFIKSKFKNTPKETLEETLEGNLKVPEEPQEELKISDSETYCANCQSYNVHLMQYWKNPPDAPPYIDRQVYICQDCGRRFPISTNTPLQ